MEKIKNNTFKKFENNRIEGKVTLGGTWVEQTRASTEQVTGWFSTDSESDSEWVADRNSIRSNQR